MPRFVPHSEETKRKIATGQNTPEILEKKRKAAYKYWKDVKSGKRPRKNGGGRPPKPMEERFWRKVVKQRNGCWLFVSNHGGGDYGMLQVSKDQEYFAHRISWIIHKGPIPDRLRVLHTCDVPKCVNPDHLFLGTNDDNMKDMVAKGRSLKGEKQPLHKLTERNVKKIRLLYATGRYSQTKLANMFGVIQNNISKIVRRVTWTHI